jgi:hypothetical protein
VAFLDIQMQQYILSRVNEVFFGSSVSGNSPSEQINSGIIISDTENDLFYFYIKMVGNLND